MKENLKDKNKSELVSKNGFPKLSKNNCFKCKEEFLIKYNPGIGMPSQKNHWLYWTNEDWDHKQMRKKPENERGDKICNSCLKTIYLKKEWELLEQIKNETRRQTLRSYIYHGII